MRKQQVGKMVFIGGILGALFFSVTLADINLAAPQPQWARPMPSLRRASGSGPLADRQTRHRLVITYHSPKADLSTGSGVARERQFLKRADLAFIGR